MRILAAILLLLLAGCSAREPASTDNHHRLPDVRCHLERWNSGIVNVCCDQTGCSVER